MKTSNAVLKPCIQAYLNVKDADKAIEFYKKAFGAKEKAALPLTARWGTPSWKLVIPRLW